MNKIREQRWRRHLRRLALALLEAGRQDLRCRDQLGDAEVVHRIRVSMKRLRALLHLLSARLPAAEHKRMQSQCRDLGRLLASARDNQVAFETLQGLAGAQLAASGERLLGVLQREVQQESLEISNELPAWTLIDQRLVQLTEGLHALALKRVARRHLQQSLSTSFQLGRADWKALRNGNGEMEPLHDWRKQVKRLYYQRQWLQSGATTARQPPAGERLKRLGDLLGQLHDLDMLEIRLAQLRRHYWQEDLQWLAPRLRERRDALLIEALALGRQLYRHSDWV